MEGFTRDAMTAASIVDAAADGDAMAFARLVAAYHPDMIRVAFVVSGGDQDVADDAVQGAWAIAWRKLGSVRDRDRIRPWLVAVAANEARQLCRRRRMLRQIPMGDGPALDALEAAGADPDERADVLDLGCAIGRLSPDARVLLALRYEAGLDSSEIGALLGRPAATVRWRLARVVASLRKELGDA